VPSVRLRVELAESHGCTAQRRPQTELMTALAPEFLRQRTHANATG
jgi:hypothetical protein